MTLVKKEFREKLEHGNREKRATLKHALLWENGMIPYVFTGVYRGNLHYSSLAIHAVSCSIMQYHAALCSIMQYLQQKLLKMHLLHVSMHYRGRIIWMLRPK